MQFEPTNIVSSDFIHTLFSHPLFTNYLRHFISDPMEPSNDFTHSPVHKQLIEDEVSIDSVIGGISELLIDSLKQSIHKQSNQMSSQVLAMMEDIQRIKDFISNDFDRIVQSKAFDKLDFYRDSKTPQTKSGVESLMCIGIEEKMNQVHSVSNLSFWNDSYASQENGKSLSKSTKHLEERITQLQKNIERRVEQVMKTMKNIMEQNPYFINDNIDSQESNTGNNISELNPEDKSEPKNTKIVSKFSSFFKRNRK